MVTYLLSADMTLQSHTQVINIAFKGKLMNSLKVYKCESNCKYFRLC